jgi:ribosomal silencing factor RsfS
MNAQARGFYQLEKLWTIEDAKESEPTASAG